jgi:SAM-dependent methyltransferase
MPTPDYYIKHHNQYHDRTFHIDPSAFLLPFVKHLQPGVRVLDIGCGSGRDLQWLTERGFRATGFEGSGGLAALARKNTGCEVIEGDFEVFDFSTLKAEALLLSGALVHLPCGRMEPVLRNMLRTLARGTDATVYVSLKEGRGSFTDSQGRTFYLWDQTEAQATFQEIGLRVLNFARTTSMLGTGETWIGYVLKKEAFR